ncbi:MAG: hypothetical protein ACKOSS_10285 [Planctomycetia bacterium]
MRILAAHALLTLLVSLAAAALCWAVAGPEAAATVPWAAGVTLAGTVLGRLAGRLVPQRTPEAAAQAALAGMGVRMIATLVLAWLASQAGVTPLAAFGLVLGALYLSALVLEVAHAAAEVRGRVSRLPSPPGPSSRDGAGA